MNRQKAIDIINNLRVESVNGRLKVDREDVVSIIEEIDEPQKPVIPQFVADWIEKCKEKDGYTLSDALSPNVCPLDIDRWFYLDASEKENLFARAWIFGYEIEQEQMYTVVIPNPNIDKNHVSLLRRSEDDKLELRTFAQPDLSRSIFHFTEDEIKEDFEWAWAAGFAKPVED